MAEITSGPDSVTGVSEHRLGFDPSGEMRVYRDQLRAALKELQSAAGAGLSVTYAAPDAPGAADLENVALYNVGAGSYSHLLAGGLTCLRVDSPDGRHHLTYAVAAGVPALPAGRKVAKAEPVSVPARSGDASAWWLAFRQQVRVERSVTPVGDAGLVVDVRLAGPWTGPAVANVVKPLLDGLFCALAAHDGSGREEVVPRLAHLGNPRRVWELLCDPSRAALGVRRLVRTHGAGVAWNAPDERCVAFRFAVAAGDGPRQAAVSVATC